jgi:hypothetical protein
VFHLATTIYGFFVFSAINFGAIYFNNRFLAINGDDGFDQFSCNLKEAKQSDYNDISTIAAKLTNRATCLENIVKIFDIIDKDKNGFISRCEDAQLQYASGSKAAYAFKFSDGYTKAGFSAICYQDFKN